MANKLASLVLAVSLAGCELPTTQAAEKPPAPDKATLIAVCRERMGFHPPHDPQHVVMYGDCGEDSLEEQAESARRVLADRRVKAAACIAEHGLDPNQQADILEQVIVSPSSDPITARITSGCE